MTWNRSSSWPLTTAALLAAGATDLRALRPVRAWHVALRGGLAVMLLFTGLRRIRNGGRPGSDGALRTVRTGLLVTFTGILELTGALGIRKVGMTSLALHRTPRTGRMAKAPNSALAPATV